MPDPSDLDIDDDIAPSDKDPAEGADGATSTPAPHVPSHLGPAGDPAEGRD